MWLPACFHSSAAQRNRADRRKYNSRMRSLLAHHRHTHLTHRRAFSLVELLIVILIILILAALVASAFVKIRAVVRALDPKSTPPAPTSTPAPTPTT